MQFVANSAPTGLDRYTTLGLGGPAQRLVTAATAAELVKNVRALDEAGEPLLILAGGSNVVIADAGFAGTVVLVRESGIHPADDGETVLVRVAAGHNFDGLVSWSISQELAGIECLSGVPGSVGATPIQNVGAYGQEVAEVIRRVWVYDRADGSEQVLTGPDCGFGYRTSIFKHQDRWVVLAVEFALTRSAISGELRFGELTNRLAARTAPLGQVRETVLGLRRAKGMVLDPADPDTRSAGSFFTNPILDPTAAAAFAEAFPEAPRWELPGGGVKTSAGWLIGHAGFPRGYGFDGVAISSKHTLALTNTGAGSTTALLALAREIRDTVSAKFGIQLTPEPQFVGVEL